MAPLRCRLGCCPVSGMETGTGPRTAPWFRGSGKRSRRSEEHTSELQSQSNLVCRLLLEKKKEQKQIRQDEHMHDRQIQEIRVFLHRLQDQTFCSAWLV